MTNQDWISLFQMVPEHDRPKLMIVLKNGTELSVETIMRFEPNFLAMRGRVGGQTEEGRGFLIPYDQMLYLRLEKMVGLEEFQAMLEGGRTHVEVPETKIEVHIPQVKTPTTFNAEAAAARAALLERLRAKTGTHKPASSSSSPASAE